MQRRKFLATVGTLAAGSAAAMGTGAFTQMSASRTSNIDVVNDDNGLIALDPQLPSDTVSITNGELSIDLDPNNEGTGVNPNSEYHFGKIPIPYDSNDPESAAFHVVNNDTVEHDIKVTWTQDEWPNNVEWPLYFRFWVGNEDDDGDRPYNGDTESYALIDPARGNSESGSVTKTVTSGEYAAVAFKLVIGKLKPEAEPPLDFSGTFTIEAD